MGGGGEGGGGGVIRKQNKTKQKKKMKEKKKRKEKIDQLGRRSTAQLECRIDNTPELGPLCTSKGGGVGGSVSHSSRSYQLANGPCRPAGLSSFPLSLFQLIIIIVIGSVMIHDRLHSEQRSALTPTDRLDPDLA